MQKITPFLWFDGNAEEAVNFYTSVFKDSKITSVARTPKGVPAGPEGGVMVMTFELNGQEFTALNGGPHFKFTEAVSFVVNCETQEEVDYYWNKLSEGGQQVECGWLKDKYGLAWQITPTIIGEVMSSGDPAATAKLMAAVMTMKKLDIAALKKAVGQA